MKSRLFNNSTLEKVPEHVSKIIHKLEAPNGNISLSRKRQADVINKI